MPFAKTNITLALAVLLVPSPSHTAPPAPIPLYKQPNAAVERRVADLLKRMTIEEKARQLDLYSGSDVIDKKVNSTHAALDSVLVEGTAEQTWGNLGVGGIHDLYPSAELSNAMQTWVMAHSRLGIPALFIEEGLHGYLGFHATVFPHSIALATTWNPGLAHATAAAIAAEARSNGIGMLLGPVLDVAREPRWGRVEEDFGEDPCLTGILGLNYVEGMQGESLATDHTVIAEPKHFAGHGSPEGGLNAAPVHAGEREVRTIMLRSFEPAIRGGHAMGIMAAYHEIDGVPSTDNPFLMTQILRGEWGFDGFVLSDLGAIEQLYSRHHVAASPAEAVREALTAGVDMQFYDFDHATFQNAIIDGVRTGKLPLAVVDRAVSRVLRVKFALGLFDHPFVDPALNAKVQHSASHLDLALNSARQAMCLLKNENKLLPLSKTLKTIAVIGPNAATARLGDYSDGADLKSIPSLLDGVKAIVLPQTKVLYDAGADISSSVALAKQADVVILALGEHQGISGEGYDRSDLNLPGNQEALLEAVVGAGVPVVLVLQNGRPLTIPWAAEHIPAILEAWYPGERGAQAMAETLFGENNPAGRLPISFPRSVGELPDFYNADPSKTGGYIDANRKSLYPFGHGLSYTSFHYDDLKVTSAPTSCVANADVAVSVRVTNSGDRAGDEVVQLYLHHDSASVETPNRALEGFERVALAAGQSKSVTFHLRRYQLEVWGAQRTWSVEPGKYTVMVGGDSDASLSARFRLGAPPKAAADGSITLEADDATIHGSNLRIAEEDGEPMIGYWDDPAEYPSWTVALPRGTYRVETEFSTGKGPSAFEVRVGGSTVQSGVVETAGFHAYKTKAPGTVKVGEPGTAEVSVRARVSDGQPWGPVNVRWVRLVPVRR